MADVHPIVRIDQASGYVYLRESVIVAFFLDPPIASSSSELLSAFDLFLSMVPDGALRWESIGASSEEWKPIDKSTLKRCRAQLSPQAAAKRRLTSFELADGERAGDVPNYGFLVLGGQDDQNSPARNVCSRCRYRLPSLRVIVQRPSFNALRRSHPLCRTRQVMRRRLCNGPSETANAHSRRHAHWPCVIPAMTSR